MEVALCVCLTSQSSIALCCVTTVTSSPPLPSIPTTAARTPGSNGRTSLVQPTKTFLNVQVDAYTTSNLPIMFLHPCITELSIAASICTNTASSCTGFRYTLRPLHRAEYYLPSPCPLVTQTEADTVKTRFCDLLSDFVDKDQINCTTSNAFIQCPKTAVTTVIPPNHPELNP